MLVRVGFAVLLLFAAFLITAVDRGGYRDSVDGKVSLLDAAYYAAVTLTTTGYGDIVPASPAARLANLAIITPLRVLFVVLLVGTTLEVLTRRTRQQFRTNRWRSRMRDHTVIIGYGTKGRTAARSLIASGRDKSSIVVVDSDPQSVAEATGIGLAGVVGDGTRSAVLNAAAVQDAKEIIVAAHRDDTAVLITLTARQLNPGATVITAVREAENVPLVQQSGATDVITTSEAAGRILATATISPATARVVEDLLVYGEGLDVNEREVQPHEVGRSPRECVDLVLAVLRDGELLRHGDSRVGSLRTGDCIVVVHSTVASPNR